MDKTAIENSAIRNLLIIEKKEDIYCTQYSNAFYHRSIAAFLIAENLIEAFLNNNTYDIKKYFIVSLKMMLQILWVTNSLFYVLMIRRQ